MTTRYYFEDKLEEVLSTIVVKRIIDSYYNQIKKKYRKSELNMLKTKEGFYEKCKKECRESYILLATVYSEEEIFQMISVDNVCQIMGSLLECIDEEAEGYYQIEDKRIYQSNGMLN